MPDTFVKIASVTVGSGGASSIDFTSIPSTYTDLCLKFSIRTAYAGVYDILNVTFNGGGTYIASKNLYGLGSGGTGSDGYTTGSSVYWAGYPQGNSTTSSTFGNNEIYIPNYAGSTNKSFSYDYVVENNGSSAMTNMGAGLWSNTSAITSFSLSSANSSNFMQYSTATLYGIKNS